MNKKRNMTLSIVSSLAAIAAIAVLTAPRADATGRPTKVPGCTYNGSEYSDGAVVCMSGYEYRCNGGGWDSLNTKCEGEACGR